MFSLHPKKYWFLTTSTFGQCLGNSMNFQPLCFLKVTKAPVSFQLADATRMVAIHSDPAPAVLGVASKVVFWSWSVDPFRCFSLGLLASLEREAHPIMYFLVIRQGSKILFEITPVTQMEQGVFLFSPMTVPFPNNNWTLESQALQAHRTLFSLWVLDPHGSQSAPGTLHSLAQLRRPHRSQRPAALRGWLLRCWASMIHWKVLHPLVTCGQQAFHSWDCMAQVAVFLAKLGGSLGNHGSSEAGAGQNKLVRSHCIDPRGRSQGNGQHSHRQRIAVTWSEPAHTSFSDDDR